MKKLFAIIVAVLGTAINTFAQDDIYGSKTAASVYTDKGTIRPGLQEQQDQKTLSALVDYFNDPKCADCAKNITDMTNFLNIYRKAYNWTATPFTEKDLTSIILQSKITRGSDLQSPIIYTWQTDKDGYSSYRPEAKNPERKYVTFNGMPYIMFKGVVNPQYVMPVIGSTPANPPAVVKAPVTDANMPVIALPKKTDTVYVDRTEAQAPKSGGDVIININQPAANYGTYSAQEVVPIGYTVVGAQTAYVPQPRTYGVPSYGYGYGYGGVGFYAGVSIGTNYPYGTYGYYGYPAVYPYGGYHYPSHGYYGGCSAPVVVHNNCGSQPHTYGHR